MPSSRDVDLLLDRLCVRLGFCLPPDARDALRVRPPADVRAFTDAVFLAEGLDPSTADRHLYRQVRDMIREAIDRARRDAEDPD
jgi:hypothetical protein